LPFPQVPQNSHILATFPDEGLELQIATRFRADIPRWLFNADTLPLWASVLVGNLGRRNASHSQLLPLSLLSPVKGYPITIHAPGNNKKKRYSGVVQELGTNFEQVVLLGYPFLKNVIDEAASRRGVSGSSIK